MIINRLRPGQPEPACRPTRDGARPRLLQLLLQSFGALLGLCLAVPALAQGAVVKTDQARVELLAHAPDGLTPGKSLLLGLKIEHQPHWHTYWKNPGDSGLPTTLAFELPAGFAVGEIAWPTPKPLPVGPLVNFGYEGTLLLPVQVSVPADFRGDVLDVKLRADWLICKDVCIPEGGEFRLSVPARAATSVHAALFASASAAVPAILPGVRGDARVDGGSLAVTVQGLPPAWRGKTLAFLPELAGVIDNAAKPRTAWTQAPGETGPIWQAQVPLSPQRSESPSAMAVVLVAQGEARGVQVPVTVAGPWPAPGTSAAAGPSAGLAQTEATAPIAASGSELSFWLALLLAAGGGVLLNLMPCVFPVLSLKVVGFAAHAHERRLLLAGGLAYTAGVVLSFIALAAVLITLRAGGEQLGWGFQLQSPAFVAALAALFALIGLNLAGVFEIGSVLPGSMAAARARHPMVDAALTGVLTVVAASPCTAPFMGASLGLAATLPATQALAIFVALGLGMAAPYLVASTWPAVARALPRPGPWMASFKALMAFPMFATVVWLVWVLGQQVGIDGAAALLGALVALAFAAWALGSSLLAGRARWIVSATALLVLALTLGWALPTLRQDARAAVAPAEADLAWQAWSPERVQASLAEGRPVFVDFTAAWCVTCQFNKRTTLSDRQVLADFQARRVTLMRADWTRRDSAISAELARLQRNGVPVYALYAPGGTSPRLLNEILTVREIRDALGALP